MYKFENCEHLDEVECWKSKGNRKLSLECKKNCGKALKCGHPCRLRCSDNCEGTPCESCAKIERKKAKMQSELQAKAVEEKQKELEVEIQKLQQEANEGILKLEMLPHGDTAEAYFLVHSGTIEIAMISFDCTYKKLGHLPSLLLFYES
jgi:hypothetical protein